MRYEYMHAEVSTVGSTARKVGLGALGGEFGLCLTRGESGLVPGGRGGLPCPWCGRRQCGGSKSGQG